MLFSYKLLGKLVDLSSIGPEALASALTAAGFEVERTLRPAQASSLVIGKIVSCHMHPGSDHLHVLKVDTGDADLRDIVCGAPNAAAGEKVIVALPGCVLPAIGKTISSSTIMGSKSDGMCCSLSELGVDKSAQAESELDGIHILPEDAPVGSEDVLGYLGLDDVILDINILPNRPDCLSHLGLAREITLITGALLKKSYAADLPAAAADFRVGSSTEACPAFYFLKAEGLRNGPALADIGNYLRALGLRPIDRIVDLGNFSMIMTGQPLHLYDLDKVEGGMLEVRDDYEGPFKALDGKTYDLIRGDLVVCDAKGPVCLAGIIGGAKVAVGPATSRIGIEAASFYHASIRHTAARLGLTSDASNLFAKGVNPYLIKENLKITAGLLGMLFGGQPRLSMAFYDKVAPFAGGFAFSEDALRAHLGGDYSDEEIDNIIGRLGLARGKGGLLMKTPYRLDLNEQCDIEEEVFRLLPVSRIRLSLDGLPLTSGGLTPEQAKVREIRSDLIANGLTEIITYTLINAAQDQAWRVFPGEASYKVAHPLTADHMIIRAEILASMAEALSYNLGRKNSDAALFEISTADRPDGNRLFLSLGLTGLIRGQGLIDAHEAGFFDVKGLVEDVLDLVGLDSRRYSLRRSGNKSFHPGRSADIIVGRRLLGTFGEASPAICASRLVLAELDLGALLGMKSSRLRVQPLNPLQPIRRDLAFRLLSDEVSADDIIREIKRSGGKYVVASEVFDSFRKDGVAYLAFATTFAKEGKSFTDAEINSLLNTIILDVTHKLRVELRS